MIADWLVNQLSSRRWGKAELSRRTGISLAVFNGYIGGGVDPGPDDLALITGAFDVPVEVVLSESQERETLGDKSGAVDFVDWLKRQLAQRGWRQAELARRSGLTPASISNYFKNRRKHPDSRALAVIARALDLPDEVVFKAAGVLSSSSLQGLSPEQMKMIAVMTNMPTILQRVAVHQVIALRMSQDAQHD